jgi:sugar phosphate isomerase/epimerase
VTWTVGVSTGGCTERPIIEVIDAAAQAGVQAVELGTPPRHFAPWDPLQVEAVRQRVQAAGIAAVSLHAPFGGILDLSEPNPRHREAAVAAILTAAEALARVGGRIVVVHPTDVVRHGQQVEPRLDRCSASLWELAAGCQRLGLVLALESPLRHLIGGECHEFARLLAGGPPAMRVCLDTGHLTLGHQWQAFLDLAADRLVHVHATDHHGHRDDHLPPGDGATDWAWIVRTLRAARYDGAVILEIKCCEDGNLPQYFRRACERFTRMLG